MRDDAKDYPSEYEPNTSHAHAVELLARSGRAGGLVLDVGCGNAPVAEPLAEAGWGYVGLDIDEGSLEALAARGFETHHLDLTRPADELVAQLRQVVGERPLGAVLALDVLEHLADPRAALGAFEELAAGHPGCSLVVSIPNVTHVDVAVRLLLGRWEMTAAGLLDDTHLRFFSAEGFDRLFAATGWRQVDDHDTDAYHSDQFELERTTALQPGTPLRDLLWRVRQDAGPHATTYQFVRRFELAPAGAAVAPGPDRPRADLPGGPRPPFLTVVARVAGADDVAGLPTLLADLAAQDDPDLEVVVLVDPATTAGADGAVAAALDGAAGAGLTAPVQLVAAEAGPADRNEAIAAARGAYVAFLDGAERVGPRYVAAFRRGAGDTTKPDATDPVVRLAAAALEPGDLVAGRDLPFDRLVRGVAPVEPDGFDLLRAADDARTVLGAYAVPMALCRTVGVRFHPGYDDAAPTLFVARAVELCGLRGVGDLQLGTDEDRARHGALDFSVLAHRLGEGPFVLGPGSVARLAALRKAVLQAAVRCEELEQQLDDRGQELADLQAGVDGVLASRPVRYSNQAREALGRVKKLIA